MANLPPSLSMKSVALSGASSSSSNDRKLLSAEQLILDLSNPELRENALHELSKVISLSLTREFFYRLGLRFLRSIEWNFECLWFFSPVNLRHAFRLAILNSSLRQIFEGICMIIVGPCMNKG